MNFRNLEVWKRSVRLSAELYQGLRGLKDYGFKDQITRSGLSVPSNIAEGYGRGSVKETIQFLHYAKGSCAELQTQIIIGIEVGYIENQQGIQWQQESEELSAMLGGLIKTKRQHISPPK